MNEEKYREMLKIRALSDSELLEWKKFPEIVRNDQCFSAIRTVSEQAEGKKCDKKS